VNSSAFRNEVEGFFSSWIRTARALLSQFDRTKVVAALDALNQQLSVLISNLAFWAAPPSVEVAARIDEITLTAQPILGDLAGLQVTLAGQLFDQTLMFGAQGTVVHTWHYSGSADTYKVQSSAGNTVSVSFPLEVEIVITVPATDTRLGAKTVVTTPPTAPMTFPLQKL
jgi:hypothetical protein